MCEQIISCNLFVELSIYYVHQHNKVAKATRNLELTLICIDLLNNVIKWTFIILKRKRVILSNIFYANRYANIDTPLQ